MAKPRIATIHMCGCFGCHMSLLDLDERLLELVEVVDFDRSPITDYKDFSQRCQLGFLEGSCNHQHDVEQLRRFRDQCDVLVSVGDCAINGDVPALRNGIPLKECFEEAYLRGTAVNPTACFPSDPELPLMLDRVYPCHEVVEIDHFLPGCPPSADAIWDSLKDLLAGRPIRLSYLRLKYD